jgi:hypothetical protein
MEKLNKLKQIVTIDIGHGGTDTGAVDFKAGKTGHKIVEADTNLIVGHKVGDYLQKMGIGVAYTRNNNDTVSYKERVKTCEQAGADMFISFHQFAKTNGVGLIVPSGNIATRTDGTKRVNRPEQEMEISKLLMSQIETAWNKPNAEKEIYIEGRDTFYDRLAVFGLQNTPILAYIIELGSVQKADTKYLFDNLNDGTRVIATGIGNALALNKNIRRDKGEERQEK